MNHLDHLPWTKIHEFLLMIGSIRAPKDLCINVAEKAHQLISYDQARIYFLNDNGKIHDMVLYGADRNWIALYLEHYSKIENGRYDVGNNKVRSYGNVVSVSFDRDDSRFSKEFLSGYIRPQGLRHSLSVSFHDDTNLTKTVCTLDRTTAQGYTKEEIQLTEIVQSHLDNLHKNLFIPQQTKAGNLSTGKSKQPLTQRESEIVQLICEGVTPINIANKLCLSKATVYKHIANIYEKLNISNRQELILTVLNK